MRSANDDVQRKWRIDGEANLHRLIELVASAHHDKDIHVAIRMRPTISMRTEKDDLFGPKLLRNLLREPPNRRFRHVLPAIKGPRGISDQLFASHITILSRVSPRLEATRKRHQIPHGSPDAAETVDRSSGFHPRTETFGPPAWHGRETAPQQRVRGTHSITREATAAASLARP